MDRFRDIVTCLPTANNEAMYIKSLEQCLAQSTLNAQQLLLQMTESGCEPFGFSIRMPFGLSRYLLGARHSFQEVRQGLWHWLPSSARVYRSYCSGVPDPTSGDIL